MLRKKVVKCLLWLLGLVIAAVVVCNVVVGVRTVNRTFDSVDDVPQREYGLLLGSTPMTRYGYKNYFFVYRIDAAERLYKSGKVKRIIISGDSCSLNGCNEPVCMRDSLVARGVPAEIFSLDGTGFSTVNSIQNAQKIYNAKEIILISQRFHNERAIILADSYDIDAIGYNAKNPNSKMQ